MDYNEVLQRARARMAPRCKVCPECNGLGCGNTMPGPGSKAPGNGANDNWRAWRRWCLNMDTIAPNTPVDTSLELLGRTFSLPVIAAPIGSLRAQFNPEDDIRDYNACCIAAAADRHRRELATGWMRACSRCASRSSTAASACCSSIRCRWTPSRQISTSPTAQPFAVSVVIDSAGLPHLKAASPDAGSKTVASCASCATMRRCMTQGHHDGARRGKGRGGRAAAIVVSNHGGRVPPGGVTATSCRIADAVGIA
ncbi:MAG: alpha-hydroxy-acid oxidizing protein [Oscillospiraceae bacterium]